MSTASVRAFLAAYAPDIVIIEQTGSTATVAEAAGVLGVEAAQIAKTLSIRVGEQPMLVVACGDARLDNRKIKAVLGHRPRMLGAQEAEELTGHPIGGVCPFGLDRELPIWCDVSLRRFAKVYPAAGSRVTSLRIAPDRLAALVGAFWADLCTIPGG